MVASRPSHAPSSLWGKCDAQQGMLFGGRGFFYMERIDRVTGPVKPMEDGEAG